MNGKQLHPICLTLNLSPWPVRIWAALDSVTLFSVTLRPFKSRKEGWLPCKVTIAEGRS